MNLTVFQSQRQYYHSTCHFNLSFSGKCSTLSQLLIRSSFSRENDHLGCSLKLITIRTSQFSTSHLNLSFNNFPSSTPNTEKNPPRHPHERCHRACCKATGFTSFSNAPLSDCCHLLPQTLRRLKGTKPKTQFDIVLAK